MISESSVILIYCRDILGSTRRVLFAQASNMLDFICDLYIRNMLPCAWIRYNVGCIDRICWIYHTIMEDLSIQLIGEQ